MAIGWPALFSPKTAELRIEVGLTAYIAVMNPFDFFVEPDAEIFPFAYPDDLRTELAPYLETEPAGPRLAAFLKELPREASNTVEFLVDLNARLQREIRYGIRMKLGVQTPDETLEAASGSCRDSAWLLVQVLRHLGLASRFVSGYLIQLRADIDPLDGPRGPDNDFTDLHAWLSLSSRRGLDRLRRHIGAPLRRRPYPTRRNTALPLGRAHQRRRGARQRGVRLEMRVTRIAERRA